MGDCIMRFYREKVKSTWKIAFFSAVIIGFLTHIYKFTNILPVADSMYNVYNSQNMVASGRWFLSVACSFSTFFDLPWIIGIVSLFFMGLTAVVITEVFEMKNPCLIGVSSGLLVTFPAIYATMGFEFTADGYMLAMLLSALSVYLTKMEAQPSGRPIVRKLLSAVCICLSCGIYQAYISFSFILAICYFMTELLENRHDAKKYGHWIVTQVILYLSALAAYYIIWKICLSVQGCEATSYQGIDRIGTVSTKGILNTALGIIRSFVLLLLEWDIAEYGLTRWNTLNILIVAAFVIGICSAIYKSGCLKRKVHLLLMVLCLAAIPFGCYILRFASSSVYYHGIMIQSVCVLYIFAGVIWERWWKPKFSTAAFVLLCVMVFNNSLMANTYYHFLDQSFKRTQAVAAEVNTRIHLLDDGTIKYVALVGGLDGYDGEPYLDAHLMRELGPWKVVSRTLLSEMYLYTYTDFQLAYYRENKIPFPKAEFDSDIMPAPADWEFYFPMPSVKDRELLLENPEVREMPIWPAADSVRVFDDTIVIKLSNSEWEEE